MELAILLGGDDRADDAGDLHISYQLPASGFQLTRCAHGPISSGPYDVRSSYSVFQ